MIVANSEAQPDLDEEAIRLLRMRRVDGMIVSLSDEQRPETVQELRRFRGPVVLLDREVPGIDASVVIADHRRGIRVATEHLLDHGHRAIGFISGLKGIRPTQLRVEGFVAAFRDRNLEIPHHLVRLGTFETEYAEQATHQLIAQERVTAIICGGNMLLTGVLRTLRGAGLAVGQDISLVSCDDVPLAELYDPPITVVHRDTHAMGIRAAELLLGHLDSTHPEAVKTVVPTELIIRSSVQRPATS